VWKAAIKEVDQVTTSILLQKQIEDAAALITDQLISRCLDHVGRYYLHCMRGEPLEKFDPRLPDVGPDGEEEEKEEEKYPEESEEETE